MDLDAFNSKFAARCSSFASQDCSCTGTGGGMSSRMLYLHGAGGWPRALVLSHLLLSVFQLGSHKCDSSNKRGQSWMSSITWLMMSRSLFCLRIVSSIHCGRGSTAMWTAGTSITIVLKVIKFSQPINLYVSWYMMRSLVSWPRHLIWAQFKAVFQWRTSPHIIHVLLFLMNDILQPHRGFRLMGQPLACIDNILEEFSY